MIAPRKNKADEKRVDTETSGTSALRCQREEVSLVAMPVIPIYRALREQDRHEFKASTDCKTRACLNKQQPPLPIPTPTQTNGSII